MEDSFAKFNLILILSLILVVLFVCAVITLKIKLRKNNKPMTHNEKIIAVIIILIFMAVDIFVVKKYTLNIYHDSTGKSYLTAYSVAFYDDEGNKYEYDFDKHGYDFLYKNGTDEKIPAKYCYVNENGELYYDKNMNIIAQSESNCVDEFGNVYYPVITVKFDKNGKVSGSYVSLNYDRTGTAYSFSPVPYFDESGNKYSYSFDSESLKGYYTNLATGQKFENDYSFVDENGYYVYDAEHNFVKQTDAKYNYQYMDSDGKIYYWASGVTWDEQGRLHDSLDRVVE